jgi:hypothetical protein
VAWTGLAASRNDRRMSFRSNRGTSELSFLSSDGIPVIEKLIVCCLGLIRW